MLGLELTMLIKWAPGHQIATNTLTCYICILYIHISKNGVGAGFEVVPNTHPYLLRSAGRAHRSEILVCKVIISYFCISRIELFLKINYTSIMIIKIDPKSAYHLVSLLYF